jgi:hypothetical protein
MAGMFCSLKEAAERLGKTENELIKLVKQGKLREFRDGPHLLLKIDEIEALGLAEGMELGPEGPRAEAPPPAPLPRPIADEPQAEPAELEVPAADESPEAEVPELEPLEPELSEPEMPELEPSGLDDVDLEIPELEVSEPAEGESPDLDVAELGMIEPDEGAPVAEAGEPEVPAVAARRAKSKTRRNAKARIEKTATRQTLSIREWLVGGLKKDNPIAVIVLILLLAVILAASVGVGYLIYTVAYTLL